ncbi:MAG: twin arginine-targeting protein translocase TatC [Deltaproteobacteria bacterium RBG_19FT_COMBO_46_9]|nr:MAG: twin arginine-targeting protein translocase TatC [Deltaproteobacteria bacterium RBG_19FT_COMBO_46_9]
MNDDKKQSFLSHLEELRERLIKSFIAVGVGCIIGYIFKEELFNMLLLPLKDLLPEGERLIFTGLPEMFFTYLKTAFIAGILFASPVVFYQIWMFIAPGLYQHEKRYIIPFIFFSTILFVGGALFGYFIVFPLGFKFFLGYSNEYLQALPSVKKYFSLSYKLLLAFGIVFQLPLLIYFMSKMGLVTVDFLRKRRPFAVLMAFIIGAILTPPDIISQIMMAIPLIVLYEIGIIVSMIGSRKKSAAD